MTSEGAVGAAAGNGEGAVGAAASNSEGAVDAAAGDWEGAVGAAAGDSDGAVGAATGDSEGTVDTGCAGTWFDCSCTADTSTGLTLVGTPVSPTAGPLLLCRWSDSASMLPLASGFAGKGSI